MTSAALDQLAPRKDTLSFQKHGAVRRHITAFPALPQGNFRESLCMLDNQTISMR